MALTSFFAQLQKYLKRSKVYIESINENENSIRLVFKDKKITDEKVSNFVSKMKMMASKHGFKDLTVYIKIENGGKK
jgi:hypothetical protein